MRQPKYLSPTSVNLWRQSREEFYMKYLTDTPPPRPSQTQPMSIGSAFDARVKSHIASNLFGEVRSELAFEKLFHDQVESHNRDWAFTNSEYVFDSYVQSGALADMMAELELALDEPIFEFRLEKNIKHDTWLEGVPLLGYPDVYFINNDGILVIYDWKVNGYCSKSAVSPNKGYVKISDGWKGQQSKSHNTPHKDAQLMLINGMNINIAERLNDLNEGWANQLTVYSWLLGCPIGSPFIAGIDQLACGKLSDGRPPIRVARFRSKVSEAFQQNLILEIVQIWQTIASGHIFDEMTKEQNDLKCADLDEMHKAFESDNPNQEWFNNLMGR